VGEGSQQEVGSWECSLGPEVQVVRASPCCHSLAHQVVFSFLHSCQEQLRFALSMPAAHLLQRHW